MSRPINKNGGDKCDGVTNMEKLINNNELECGHAVTPSEVQGVTSVTKNPNVTPVTPGKKPRCNNYLGENYNKNNMLNVLSHPAHLSHQKNINTCMQAEKTEQIDIERLKNRLGEDWIEYKDNREALKAWDNLFTNVDLIAQSKVPPEFTVTTHCAGCGDVFISPSLINGGSVLGCPWCWNRTKGLSIPRPN